MYWYKYKNKKKKFPYLLDVYLQTKRVMITNFACFQLYKWFQMTLCDFYCLDRMISILILSIDSIDSTWFYMILHDSTWFYVILCDSIDSKWFCGFCVILQILSDSADSTVIPTLQTQLFPPWLNRYTAKPLWQILISLNR